MHDAQYRAEVARQSTAYNQPAYTSFYFASDTDWANVPLPDIFQLNNKSKQDVISPRAEKNLSYHARLFNEMWE
jgi:hypothetical protein